MYCKKLFLPFSVDIYLTIMKYIEQDKLKNNQKKPNPKISNTHDRGKINWVKSKMH